MLIVFDTNKFIYVALYENFVHNLAILQIFLQ